MNIHIASEDAIILLLSLQKTEGKEELKLRLAGCAKEGHPLDLSVSELWFLWTLMDTSLAVGNISGVDVFLKITEALRQLQGRPDALEMIEPGNRPIVEVRNARCTSKGSCESAACDEACCAS